MAIKRHHYVPQGFLRGFCDKSKGTNNFIWVYEKLPNRRPRCVSIKSIAWQEYYYHQETNSGEMDTDSLETAFAQTIDNKIPKIIRNIDAAGNSVELGEDEKGVLAYFIGILMARVPNFLEGTREFFTQIAQRGLKHISQNDPLLSKFFEEELVKAEAKEWVSLEAMLQVAEAVGYSALEKNCQFFVPPDDMSFVSSDSPVHFSISKESGNIMAGPAHPLAELIINLRSDLALVCTPKECGIKMPSFKLKRQETKIFNRGTAKAAGRFVFANHESSGIEKLTKKYSAIKQGIKI